MYTSIVTICEFVVILLYLTRNCTVNVNKIYFLFCSIILGIHCEEVKLFCDEPTNLCSEHSTCNNTHGGYYCICHDDWRGRHCDEEPYCTSSPCSNNASCINGDDGYICNCAEGWSGRNCEIEITPCTSSPCLNDGQCSVDGDTYVCNCVGIWEGPKCQTERVELSTGKNKKRFRRGVFIFYKTIQPGSTAEFLYMLM